MYEGESRYQYVDVRERSRRLRVLELNEGVVANSIWYPHSVLTGGEWDMFLLVPPLLTHPVRRVLVLGNAGGTTARALAALYPGVAIDGVELDPKVTEVSRRFLGSYQARSRGCTSSRLTRALTSAPPTRATT